MAAPSYGRGCPKTLPFPSHLCSCPPSAVPPLPASAAFPQSFTLPSHSPPPSFPPITASLPLLSPSPSFLPSLLSSNLNLVPSCFLPPPVRTYGAAAEGKRRWGWARPAALIRRGGRSPRGRRARRLTLGLAVVIARLRGRQLSLLSRPACAAVGSGSGDC